MKKVYDKNRREIMPGDTIKIFHFIGGRRKKYYMYKYVESRYDIGSNDFLIISHLNKLNVTYKLLARNQIENDVEIVQGFGNDGTSFDDRPKFELVAQQ